jgi:hypothetical protein
MTRRQFPLLLRLGKPISGESLPSFVIRLGRLNYYDPITIMKTVLFEGVEKDKLEWPSKGTTYERLFDLTWLDPFSLHNTTGHYFADVLTPLDMAVQELHLPRGGKLTFLQPKIAQQQLRPAHAVQFCPLCLRKNPYHRVAWMPLAASVCIEHKRMLVDRCPGCQKRVSVREIIEQCCCRKCGADLREADSARLGKDDFGLLSQRFIRWCLGLGRVPTASLPPKLSPWSFRAALYLLNGLVDSIKLLGSGWKHIYQPVTRSSLEPFDPIRGRPTPDQSYRLYATAFKALVKWPQGFYEFLDAYRRRDSKREKEGLFEDLGRLYDRWLSDRWLDPEFDFVQEALSQYLVDAYVTPYSTVRKDEQTGFEPPNATAFIRRPAAARLLGVSERTINRLVNAGFLIKYTADQGQPRRYGAVRQDAVLKLRLRWEGGVPLEDAAKWFGVTKLLILDFVKTGLLALDHSADLNRLDSLTFNKEDLDRCYCQLTKRVRNPWKTRSSLVETARALSVFGLKVIDIFNLVADGELEVFALTDSPSLASLTFDPRNVEELLKGPGLGRRLVDSEEAARQLGIEFETLLRWIVAGQISPVLSYAFKRYFDPDELDEFIADCIPSHEAAKIWGVRTEDVESWSWSWDWGIEAVQGTSLDGHPVYLFHRGDVERLQAEFAASELDSRDVLQSH